MQEEYLNTKETAQFLNVCISTLYLMKARREIPFIQYGSGKIRFKKSDLIHYLESCRCESISK